MVRIKRIKAFTLGELLVVLVISSILISLAMVVLTLVQKQSQSITLIKARKQEIILFERSLNQDFNRGVMHYFDRENILYKSSKMDTISYEFGDNYVVRGHDTIHVEVAEMKFYLNGNEIVKGYVDAVEILFTEKFYNNKLFIAKKNDATFYMNH